MAKEWRGRANRRRTQRFATRIPAHLSDGAPVEIVDISLQGAFIRCDAPLNQGSHVRLGFMLGETREDILATVQHVRRGPDAGAGLCFVELDFEQTHALATHLARLPASP